MRVPPIHTRPRLFVALVLLALGAAVGCSRAPLAPQVAGPGAYSNPTFAKVPAPPAGAFGASSGPLSGSADIDGAVGGLVSVGRFTVRVPAGAFAGSATVTIAVPDPSIVACNLDISPASANGFLIPVQLTADCAGATNVDLRNCGTLWHDPVSNLWLTVNGTVVDLDQNTVTASLPHFSDYGIADLLSGKAGW